MVVEFWGGPRDGERIEVADGTRFVDIAFHGNQTKAAGPVVSVRTVRCYFGRREDGTIIARWPIGCT